MKKSVNPNRGILTSAAIDKKYHFVELLGQKYSVIVYNEETRCVPSTVDPVIWSEKPQWPWYTEPRW